MRSEPIPNQKSRDEFRILAIGDSVLNGGNHTAHGDLATTLLSRNNVRVLNASAGSWGPQNMQAYIRKFGLFDADMLVVVLSEHDAHDVPSFAPLNPNTHPTHRPLFALAEGLTRYLPRYLPSLSTSVDEEFPSETAKPDPHAYTVVTDLADKPIPVCFVLHPTLAEYQTRKWGQGYYAIRNAVGSAKFIDETPFIRSVGDYRDGIHHSVAGQKALAKAISTCWR